MAEQQPEPRQGERAGDRRGLERRRSDRRTPIPPWRRSWALVAYGVVGALLLMMMFNSLGDGEPEGPPDEKLVSRNAPPETTVRDKEAPVNAPEDAYGSAGFARLVVQGDSAVGRIVRAEMFCEAPGNYTVVSADTVSRAVAGLIQEGRVPAAECKWGPAGEAQRENFLLLVPPALAGEFASTPVVTDAFVERHRVIAELEWVGRSKALALRTAGVFRGLADQ
jgi:hypothetical protein